MTRTKALRSRLDASVPRGVATKTLFVSRAQDAELWDVDGKRYIDFAAGIAVVNTGHRHPRVLQAVSAQLQQFTHTCFHVAPYESYVALAERLNRLTPGDFPKKSLFVTTGAEAVENAIKIARYATRRSAVIAFSGAFHGRTHMAMALTGKVSPYKTGFGPLPASVYHAPFPNYSDAVTTGQALRELERIFRADVPPQEVAVIIVEPVQGEGGFHVAPAEFLRALREVSDRHGIVLIVDEVQSGIARTGKMFAVEHSGVVPDLITVAKGLGGGFPLAGITGRAELMDAVHPGGLGGTFAGSPIGIAAALEVLSVIEDEDLCKRAALIGARIEARLRRLQAELPCIGDVRGLGAMQAIELVSDRTTRAPDAALTGAVLQHAQDHGLVVLSCGSAGNAVRIIPPLTLPEDVLQCGLDILEMALRSASTARQSAALPA